MEEEKTNYLEKELEYIEMMGRSIENNDYYDLFPIDWFSNKDYENKKQILKEAIGSNKLIINTNLYMDTMTELFGKSK